MLRALLVGGLAAIRAPLRVRGWRIDPLLEDGTAGTGGGDHEARSADPALSPEIFLALRVARAALRRLAYPPLSPWRNTCLYRSIAECLVLRYYDVPAAIRLGVRNESPPYGPIVAHAWVVYPGGGGDEAYIELARVGALDGRSPTR